MTKKVNERVDVFEELWGKVLTEQITEPLVWWWVSFSRSDRPVGKRCAGVVIVRARGFGMAMMHINFMGLNPGGEVYGTPMLAEFGDPPPEMLDRLLTERTEIDALATKWTGKG